MRKLLFNILPQSVIDFYKSSKKRKRLKQREFLISQNKIVTKQHIVDKLLSIGITDNDTVLLHSSLSKIGFVEGGAQTIINAFIDVIGIKGTIVMPAFPGMGFNYDYLKTNPVFDIKHTPSKMGIITEEFRKMKGVKRSLHPTDSVCALGFHAEEITNSHFNQITPYNFNSPFFKVCQLNGKIVLIGVDLNSLTNFHTLEDAVENFKFPIYHNELFQTQLIDKNGVMKIMQTKVHNPEWSKKRKCNDFIKLFENAGFLKHFTLGNAHCMIINAKDMHSWMIENYESIGVSLYTPQGS